MEEIETSWNELIKFLLHSSSHDLCQMLPNLITKFNEQSCDNDPLLAHLIVLKKSNLLLPLYEFCVNEFKEALSFNIHQNFWCHFKEPISEYDDIRCVIPTIFSKFYEDISIYVLCLNFLNQIIHGKENNLIDDYLKGIIFYKTNINFNDAIKRYFKTIFLVNDVLYSNKEEKTFFENGCRCCIGCKQVDYNCICQQVFKNCSQFAIQMKKINMLDRIIAEPLISLIQDKITEFITSKCKDSFDKQYISELYSFISIEIIDLMNELFLKIFGKCDSISFFPNSKDRLKYFVCEVYGKLRISQIFDIIIEYPESIDSLKDLLHCIKKIPELKLLLVEKLKLALETRLVHNSVHTADILMTYVSTMRALQVIDESGILLELAAGPVKCHLRNREDTVRCIVQSLTEESNNELADELQKGKLLDDVWMEDDAPPNVPWEKWNPEPIEAEICEQTQADRAFDILSTLVNIYGSRETFIDEYQSLLADRILTVKDYNGEKEIRHLELLSLKFGETHLHDCSVMLKDVSDSRRINTHIQESQIKAGVIPQSDVPLNVLILSAQFWPPRLKEEKIKLPPEIIGLMEQFTSSFELLKGNRTLAWKPHLGSVEIEITIGDQLLNLSVSPIHASIIYHFGKCAEWTLTDLCAALQVPSQTLKRKIVFWMSHGLIDEIEADIFCLNTDYRCDAPDTLNVENDEAESTLSSQHEQKEEEMNVIYSYITGMLTNLECLSLERMHTMLKMFAIQGPGSQCTIQQLKTLLDKKMQEQKITIMNGVYKLVKPTS